MQRLAKEGFLLAFVVASLILFAFALLMPTNTITNVSAVYPNGVGVYWDSDCSNGVSRIDWGNLTPWSSRSIIVYIRNEIEEPIYLILSTQDWDPSSASLYMTLRWDYTVQRMNPGEALQTTLSLSVSRSIEGISSFHFDILVTGSERLPGDVNGDGRVGSIDLGKLGAAYGSMPGAPNWNPAADFDNNGRVDSMDLSVFGLTYDRANS